mmetsp:Transcript_4891/g.11705  ORF Transcript_4891/g.11705 Transcript_4891/m.11705 type:complete len:207 (+) Transcript_4891:336-956(+)
MDSKLWRGPNARLLNTKVVNSPRQLEPAVFTPVCSPGVPSNPVVLASRGIRTVTSNGDLMVPGRAVGLVDENSAGVGLEFRGDANRTRNWSTDTNLRDHSVTVGLKVGAVNASKFFDREKGEVVLVFFSIHWEAALLTVTVAADTDGIALEVVVEILGLVVLASLVGNAVLVDPWVHFGWVAAFASAGAGRGVGRRSHAVNKHLRG